MTTLYYAAMHDGRLGYEAALELTRRRRCSASSSRIGQPTRVGASTIIPR